MWLSSFVTGWEGAFHALGRGIYIYIYIYMLTQQVALTSIALAPFFLLFRVAEVTEPSGL